MRKGLGKVETKIVVYLSGMRQEKGRKQGLTITYPSKRLAEEACERLRQAEGVASANLVGMRGK